MFNLGQAFACPLISIVMIEGFLAQNMNLAGQMIANEQNKELMREANEFNAKESEKQRQFVVEQWQRENAYNTPSAQLARLKAAGINPALAYTEGSLANTAAASSSPAEASSVSPARMVAPQVDPLTMAQIEKTTAEAEAIRESTRRSNEKQPFEIGQLKSTIASLDQSVKNMSMQEQIYSMDYLSKALAYQFQNTTFNDSVRKFTQELRSTKLGADFQEFQLRRALKLLPFEIAGYDLSNKKLQAGIALDWQEYNKVKELLPKIIREYNDKHAIDHNTTVLQSKDATLKDLEFWINASEHRLGSDWYFKSKGQSSFNTNFDAFMLELLDDANRIMESISPLR